MEWVEEVGEEGEGGEGEGEADKRTEEREEVSW